MVTETYTETYIEDRYTHQKVQLVSVTKPVISLSASDIPMEGRTTTRLTAEDLIAYCARVSNPANQHNLQSGPKLVDYLVRNNHWSPLEMVHATVEIVTTRDIARQILRHRSFSFQEFSQRYAEVVDIVDTREARLQDHQNRQSSVDMDTDSEAARWWHNAQTQIKKVTVDVYQMAIKAGIAKEVARAILPEGMTVSRLYMSGTVRSWYHYVKLRGDNGTQREHMDIAEKVRLALMPEFPTFFSTPTLPFAARHIRPGQEDSGAFVRQHQQQWPIQDAPPPPNSDQKS